MWLWWPKDISNVLWRKVITVIQAAEKLVQSVSASSSSTTRHCSILFSTWFMSSGLWQGAVNEVYNSYLETSRGVAGFSGWSHLCCCRWAEDCTCWNICTTTKLPQSWVKVSVWLTGGSDGGAHAAADSHLPWWKQLRAKPANDLGGPQTELKPRTLQAVSWHTFIHIDILKKPRQQKFLKWSLHA